MLCNLIAGMKTIVAHLPYIHSFPILSPFHTALHIPCDVLLDGCNMKLCFSVRLLGVLIKGINLLLENQEQKKSFYFMNFD